MLGRPRAPFSPRPHLVASLAIAGAAVAAVAGTVAWTVSATASPAPGPDTPQGPPATPGSACALTTTYEAAPPSLLLGEVVTHTLTVRARCPSPTPVPLHVALVFDLSQAVTRSDVRETRDAARQLVDQMAQHNPTTLKQTVIDLVVDRHLRHASKRAMVYAPLTGDLQRVKRGIERVDRGGTTDLPQGIQRATALLAAGRKLYPGPRQPSITEVMIVFSDGPRDDAEGRDGDCTAVLDAARKARASGIIVITVCVGPQCATRCMRDAATSIRYAFDLGSAHLLVGVFNRIRYDFRFLVLKRLTITDRLPSDVAYVPDSAVPAPVERDATAGHLRWAENYVPEEGITVTFLTRPLSPGHRAVSLGAVATFLDNTDLGGERPFPIPAVDVVAPLPVPTPAPAGP